VPESYVQRAELLAELGRYDEAAAELTEAAVDDVPAQTLLARIWLAAGSPKQALAAADAAVAAGPADLPALIARGMALADLGRVDDAATQAEQILRRGRGNGYACTSAAAILAGVRNGQVALDAAWEGVRLTPDQPRAHLVLGVVAAQLGLAEIAERAYREALALDPRLSVAQAPLGVVRVEHHRYATALSQFAKPATDPAPASPAAGGDEALVEAAGGLRRAIQYGAGYALVAPLLVGWAQASGLAAPLVAVVLAGAGLAGMWLGWRRLTGAAERAAGAGDAAVRAELAELLRADRSTAIAIWAVISVPTLLLVFAMLVTPWPLVLAVAAGAVALFANRPRQVG
jgi:tetratricopeptide (TPR) repeat protein